MKLKDKQKGIYLMAGQNKHKLSSYMKLKKPKKTAWGIFSTKSDNPMYKARMASVYRLEKKLVTIPDAARGVR